ncbi:YitT family protein [Lactobacillus selangorensis]|uniref:YitT family protein n=1 Tax=Lactobacillus selangorensis TaxID=81857 RepID=UPI000ADA0586|nr:YitT family protein [Lactobacillus selangorensis]
MQTARFIHNDNLKKMIIVIVSGLLAAFALKFFLIPAHVFSSGISGVAQLVSALFSRLLKLHVDTGLLILLFNVPIGILGLIKIGPNFTAYSLLTAVVMSLFTMVMPAHALSTNPLMNAIVGGVLMGVAVGLALRYGFSTGGLDIIALILAKTTGRSVGALTFAINMLIILAAGVFFGWESALYTIISIYCMSYAIDHIHTSHQKVTAMIVTSHKEEVLAAIRSQVLRGITVIDSEGGYSGRPNATLMIVITRYELYDLTQAAIQADPKAFINILNTIDVVGEFLNSDQQAAKRKVTQKKEIAPTHHDSV